MARSGVGKSSLTIVVGAGMLLAGCDDTLAVRGSEPPIPPGPVCPVEHDDTTAFLSRLQCQGDWDVLDGPPMNSSHGPATAVKFLYSLESGTLWFPNATIFPLHWNFASRIIGIPPSRYVSFWLDQYSETPDRVYVPGTVTRYGDSLWTMQLFPGDDLSREHLRRAFQALADSTWFGKSLKYLPANEAAASRGSQAGVPMASIDEVFQGQSFQGMNPGVAYGTLVRADRRSLAEGAFSPRDIVLADGLPNDLPVVAGVVTTGFQTPLSHVNVLSMNRGTPNMALRGAWTDSVFSALEGRLVRLEVARESYSIRAATPEEAAEFWETHGPGLPPELPLDTTSGLVALEDLGRRALSRVGAKAANFGELARLSSASGGAWRVPEGAFAIPFSAYLSHLRRNGLDSVVAGILSDASLRSDSRRLRQVLSDLRSRIESSPLDPVLLASVDSAIRANGQFVRMRFRSSTNAEDLAEFNGAGLYASRTGDPTDSDKPVADAIREVWASLWNQRAFAEREYFRIEQSRVAMGILVHRGFPDEGVNGVAITRNIYMDDYVGFVINAQIGETSVVDPPEGVVTEQRIVYPYLDDYLGEPGIEWISRSSLTGGEPVLSTREVVGLTEALKSIQSRFFELLATSPVSMYQYGMDVEFKIDGALRTLYIKQARPLPD